MPAASRPLTVAPSRALLGTAGTSRGAASLAFANPSARLFWGGPLFQFYAVQHRAFNGARRGSYAGNRERSVNSVVPPVMLNANVVNARNPDFMPRYFREIFPAFAPIPRLQNPFKYNCNLRVNRKTPRPPRRPPAPLSRIFNDLATQKPPICRLNPSERRIPYNAALQRTASRPRRIGGPGRKPRSIWKCFVPGYFHRKPQHSGGPKGSRQGIARAAAWPACYRRANSAAVIFPTTRGRAILPIAGSPAMTINGYRNKPFGPGGGTRRLHHKPPGSAIPEAENREPAASVGAK